MFSQLRLIDPRDAPPFFVSELITMASDFLFIYFSIVVFFFSMFGPFIPQAPVDKMPFSIPPTLVHEFRPFRYKSLAK